MSIHEPSWGAPKHFYVAVAFTVLVVILTAIIFLYKQKVIHENTNATQEISELQSTLSQLRKDEEVQAFELYSKNKNQLDILTYNSQIPLFYNEISRLSRLYNFDFSGFSFDKWDIRIAALARSNSSEEWYQKFRTLIADFYDARYGVLDDEEDTNASSQLTSILDLGFVKSFQWSNNVSSILEFIIKPEEKEEEIPELVDTTTITDATPTEQTDAKNEENAIIEAAITQ